MTYKTTQKTKETSIAFVKNYYGIFNLLEMLFKQAFDEIFNLGFVQQY